MKTKSPFIFRPELSNRMMAFSWDVLYLYENCNIYVLLTGSIYRCSQPVYSSPRPRLCMCIRIHTAVVFYCCCTRFQVLEQCLERSDCGYEHTGRPTSTLLMLLVPHRQNNVQYLLLPCSYLLVLAHRSGSGQACSIRRPW